MKGATSVVFRKMFKNAHLQRMVATKKVLAATSTLGSADSATLVIISIILSFN
jgi:hypothetical protein|tara:strand:- start:130 stop:288 length:159 start_codon:yes stop_codon:yes gene_type:complete